eukprot:GILJ01005233.1.p1 GENE.GILJ01005233.1~~GILJ01005233.1.p1  ORF type:complete len:1081 (-),score=175.82 GILJ01005233.1:102-3344(-)
MPPKKDVPKEVAKTPEEPRPVETPRCNEVIFTLSLDVVHSLSDRAHVKVSWFKAGSTDVKQLEFLDSPPLSAWNHVTDGSIPTDSQEKKRNLSRELSSRVIDENLAVALSTRTLYAQVCAPNKDGVDTVLHTVTFNISGLLFPAKPSMVNIPLPTHGLEGVCSLSLEFKSNGPLLSTVLRNLLNPLCLTLVAAKDLPNEPDLAGRCKGVQAVTKFYGAAEIVTARHPHAPTVKFMNQQVILTGSIDPVHLRTWLETGHLEVEVHDRDSSLIPDPELIPVGVEEAKAGSTSASTAGGKKTKEPKENSRPSTAVEEKRSTEKKEPQQHREEEIEKSKLKSKSNDSFGIALFSLSDLLLPNVKSLKLRSDILPMRSVQAVDHLKGDLNATAAKKDESRMETSAPYLKSGSFFVLSIDVARPLLVPPPKHSDSITSAGLQSQASLSPVPASGVGSPVRHAVHGDSIESEEIGRFQRAVYVMRYGNVTLLKAILNGLQLLNAKALGMESAPVRALATRQLTDSEKRNPNLNVITGFQIIDSRMRMIVIEGLGEGAMKEFYQIVPRITANSRRVRILMNPEVTFQSRLYTDFDVDLKKIKLREKLDTIVTKPDIYLRHKVPEDVCDTLLKLAEIKKGLRLRQLKSMDLFPSAHALSILERKYGESLTDEDILGGAVDDERSTVTGMPLGSVLPGSQTASRATLHNQSQQLNQQQYSIQESVDRFVDDLKDDLSPMRATLGNTFNDQFAQRLKERSKTAPVDFIKTNVKKYPRSSKSPRPAYPMPDCGEVYIYSGQKLQYTEWQKEHIRKEKAKDTQNVWTYSAEYQSLTLPLVNEAEIQQIEAAENRSKWRTGNGFVWPAPKRPGEYTKLDHPVDLARVEDLKTPWVENALYPRPAARELQAGQHEFTVVATKRHTFGDPSYFKSVHLVGDGIEKEKEEAKRKAVEDWKSKVVVDDVRFKVLFRNREKPSQLDRTENILKDAPQKLGVNFDKKRGDTNQTVGKTLNVSKTPFSIFVREPYTNPKDFTADLKPSIRSQFIADSDFDPIGKTPANRLHSLDKIHRPKINPLASEERHGPKWGAKTTSL